MTASKLRPPVIPVIVVTEAIRSSGPAIGLKQMVPAPSRTVCLTVVGLSALIGAVSSF